MRTLAFLGVLLVSSLARFDAPASAQVQTSPQQRHALGGWRAPAPGAPQNPYDTLFKAPEFEGAQPPQSRTQPTPEQTAGPPQPSVVCGITIVPADPSIDPKMVRQPSAGDVQHTMRLLVPPVCK